jgi:exodeoxyribonuclease III
MQTEPHRKTIRPNLGPRRRQDHPTTRRSDGGPEARVLTINIGAAAAERAGRILKWLRGRTDDVVVLSETSGGPGTELLVAGLEETGYTTRLSPEAGERGVLVASRLPVKEGLDRLDPITLPCRAQGIVLATRPQIALLGVYVPSRDRSPEKIARKESFMASLLSALQALDPSTRESLVLTGDYNAVARHHVPGLPGFFPYEYDFHDRLAELGLSPAHELRPYGEQPHSWIGRTGIGYLYDYAHLGAALAPRLRRCQYLQGPRRQRLTDHAALAIRVALD